jgi:hypothetical protein
MYKSLEQLEVRGKDSDMDTNEFNKTALRTETSSQVIFDVRPFGDRQGEAIDSYLHSVGMAVQMNVFRHTKPIMLICDAQTVFPSTTQTWLGAVRAQGVDVSIQPE